MATDEHELPKPPAVETAVQAIELARVWGVDGSQHVTLNARVWADPAAWGIMLVDLARHVANAYAQNGMPTEEALKRLRAGFDAEWGHSSDHSD